MNERIVLVSHLSALVWTRLSFVFTRLYSSLICLWLVFTRLHSSLNSSALVLPLVCNISNNPLMIMLEKWKNVLSKGEYVCVLFMDLSKAFGTINHDLLLAKLRAYGLSNNALNLMWSYLKIGNKGHKSIIILVQKKKELQGSSRFHWWLSFI